MIDEMLIDTYMCGFNDELNEKPELTFEDTLMQKAYNEGRGAAICGEDIRSVDYRTEAEILKIIKNKVVRKLTDNQLGFILDNFFKNEKYPGWKNIALKLLLEERCIVAGTECIWIGGIGNFIKTQEEPNLFGCSLYTFDLEYFISSEWFKEVKKNYLSDLYEKKSDLERQYDEIFQI